MKIFHYFHSTSAQMKAGVTRWLKKTLKIVGITILSILLLLFLLPYIMPGTISKKIKTLVNQSITGEVNFSKARLSFFNHFPALTLTLYDFTLTGAVPFENDTLLAAGEMAFGVNIPQLVRGDITVDQFFITHADINVKVNEQGQANYNVYKSSAGAESGDAGGSDTTAALRIEKIVIEKSDVLYDDQSSDVLIRAIGLNYAGHGDLSKAIFGLTSQVNIDTFDFYYDAEPYVLKKKINASLVTQVNTSSLALNFEKNKLQINRLPLEFKGRFEFLTKGYDMNFEFKSKNARLRSVFTVLPPSYNGWLKKTKLKGRADILASLKGRYIAGTDTMPTAELDMQVREGSIAYQEAPAPLTNLYLDLNTRVPQLNPDSLQLNIDSVFFNVNQDHFASSMKIVGLEFPFVSGRINSSLDLQGLDKALGFEAYDMKGKLDLDLSVHGRYAKGQEPGRIRKSIVVTSIPSFRLRSSLKGGYFHYTSLPQPLQKISFTIKADCPGSDYRQVSASIEDLDIRALDNYIKGFIRLENAKDFPIDAALEGIVRLDDIKQFYPLDSMEISGDLGITLRSNGNYQPSKSIFPKTEAGLKVANGSVKTTYYPAPVQKINVDATIQNKAGTLADLDVVLKPVSFEFEGKQFLVKADLSDFDNPRYDITSKGTIDLGKIYRVFAQEGWNVQGILETDLSLKGSASDAAAKRWSQLYNSGTLKVTDLVIYSELYPLPFHVNNGLFSFHQDKMRFSNFNIRYGKSEARLNGAVSNLFAYIGGTGPLKGDIQLTSDHIFLDELMAYNADTVSARPDSMTAGTSGVIMLPQDLDFRFNTQLKAVTINQLPVKDVKGEVHINQGTLTMNETGFNLADAVTKMNATYKSISPARAQFTYHVRMEDFDVKKMYEQVALFRELAPAAAKAEGIISLDYKLQGKLDENMYPVMPSLKGGGVLSVKKVKMKGFHLFSAMSKHSGKSEIDDPDLSKIDFKTTIANNIVTLEKTKMKVSGFRLRLQGQTSLDGQLKLKCRIGLPPFGIIGIPMNITGTGDNPRVKVGKGDELPLQEQQEEMADIEN